MKNCTECVHANWRRTKTGALHPSGDGECGKEIKIPQLPQAFFFTIQPFIGGGSINRRRELKDHCPYWQHATIIGEVACCIFMQPTVMKAP